MHLPLPPKAPVTHVYVDSDPIPQGTCTGIGSPCSQAGYALETRCHIGNTIIYPTMEKLGWRSDVRTHPIREIITRILDIEGLDWEDGREVPQQVAEIDCVVSVFATVSDRVLTVHAGLLQVGIRGFQTGVGKFEQRI